MHRDFVALIAFVVLPLVVIATFVRYTAPNRTFCVTIGVEGMCCDFTAQPAIDELSKVVGVIKAAPRYEERAIHVELDVTPPASPRSLWDAVGSTSLRPVRLVMEDGTFNSRPVE
jgi:hypothetical protein